MLNSHQLLFLYTRIFEDISYVNHISEKDLKQAIVEMHKVYNGCTNNLSKNLNSLTLANFNTVAYRSAYLFKYAPFHTALAYKSITHALTENPEELCAALNFRSKPLKLCSLGGGPGTDAIGVVAALHDKFGFFPVSVKLVDIMSEWEMTFWSVIDELRYGGQFYGYLSESVSEKWFDWSFITADLQSKMNRELNEALGSADIITMVKFVSAAACNEASNMIEKIFRIMKPGAFLLFVDNAGGGFEKLISSAATKYKFNAVFKPLKHQHYVNEAFLNIKYGYRSCYEGKVAVQFLKKPGSLNNRNEINLAANSSHMEIFPSTVPLRNEQMHVPQFQNFRMGPKRFKLINEQASFESESSFDWKGTNFSPQMERLNVQIDSSVNNNYSFESVASWNSSPHTPTSQNWPIRTKNQKYDSGYENESFGQDLSLINSHFSDEMEFPHCDNFHSSPPSFWQKSRAYSQPIDNLVNQSFSDYDSGYDNESYEHDLSLNNSHFSKEMDFLLSDNYHSPPFFRQKVHFSKLHKSKTYFQPVDNFINHSFSESYPEAESKAYINLPLNSTPQPIHRKSVRAVDQFLHCDRNKSIECNTSWNTPAKNVLLPTPVSTNNCLLPTPVSTNNCLLPTPVSQTACMPRLNTTTDDSSYLDESFEEDSPAYHSPLHIRATQRLARYKMYKRKSISSSNENDLLCNTPSKNMLQNSTLMFDNENSFSPTPFRPNLQQSNRPIRLPFKGIDNSVYHKSYDQTRPSINQSERKSHQYLLKKKAPKRCVSLSRHRHDPYRLKKY